MLLSMTGYGRAAAQVGEKNITVEIKSVNSKQMDLSVRLPASFRRFEADIRRRVADALLRGKADAAVYAEGGDAEAVPRVNAAAVEACRRQIEEVSREVLHQEAPRGAELWAVLARMPEVFHTQAPGDAGDDEYAALCGALDEALEALTAHRRSEGEKLEAFFARRIEAIGALLEKVPDYEQERIDRIRRRLEETLAAVGAGVDDARLEQEMIFYIEKLDVTEEKQRLGQHLRYFLETMALPGGGQGKKLGFIAQEMGREINTLGSKSNHAEMQRLVVVMKDNLEQIKEQVLNVL